MSHAEIAVCAAAGGLAVGFLIGYVVVKQACKDQIVDGGVGLVKKLGGGSTVQRMAGQLIRDLVEAHA